MVTHPGYCAHHIAFSQRTGLLIAMAPGQELKKAPRRKLTKKRKPQRLPSVQYPDRLKEGDDVQNDVTAARGQPAQYANQSVFSMIAAAGSKADFHSRFDDESSDSEEEPHGGSTEVNEIDPPSSLRDQKAGQRRDVWERAPPGRKHMQGNHRLQSLPKLDVRTIEEKNYMSQSSLLSSADGSSSPERLKSATPRDAPLLSRMLAAEAELGSSTELSDSKIDDVEGTKALDGGSQHSNLATRLKEIFNFERPEEVISGLPMLYG